MKKGLQSGFTIVELLIVIVVIAILAAITIVAYSGITSRAQVSADVAGLNQVNQKLAAYVVDNSVYPTDLSTIVSSGNTSYQYTYNNTAPISYCVTATTGSTSYYINSATTTPTAGACAGHGAGGVAAITNLQPNPSVETNLTGYAGPNTAVITSDTSKAYAGSTSALSTMPAKSAGATGINFMSGSVGNSNSPLALNSQYTYSAYVYVPSATVDVCLSVQGTAVVTQSNVGCTSVKDAWTRINSTMTTSGTAGTFVFYVLNKAATTANMTFWTDATMVTAGASLYNYADPNLNSSWIWTTPGSPNASMSTGPQV